MPERDGKSFYDHCIERQAGLLTSSEVVGIEHLANGQNRVRYLNKRTRQSSTMDFDALIVTVPSWIMEVKMEITGFGADMIPPAVTRAYKTAHWETSCKVYAPLKSEFFSSPDNKIPQILVTDSFIHDVYAYEYKIGGYKVPCILMSYTWEGNPASRPLRPIGCSKCPALPPTWWFSRISLCLAPTAARPWAAAAMAWSQMEWAWI